VGCQKLEVQSVEILPGAFFGLVLVQELLIGFLFYDQLKSF